MDYKFNKMKNGNVQQIVYHLLQDHRIDHNVVMNQTRLIALVQSNRWNAALSPAPISTIKRAYRRMKKVIEWKITQDKLMEEYVRKSEEEWKATQALIAKEDKEFAIFYGTMALVSTFAIIGTILYFIFTYNG